MALNNSRNAAIPRCNFIGTGKLGLTLAYLMASQGLISIGGIFNRTYAKSKNAIEILNQGMACEGIDKLPEADLFFITVPDDAIQTVTESLYHFKRLNPGNAIVHCSGALSSAVLQSADQPTCLVASLHLMRSFMELNQESATLSGTFATLEGDAAAKIILKPLFEKLGVIIFEIESQQKCFCHIASVFASNYLLALVYAAEQCLLAGGIKKPDALVIIMHLMQGTLDNLVKTQSPAKALTGPIQRGDVKTITQHLQTLQGSAFEDIYRVLAKVTVQLAKSDL